MKTELTQNDVYTPAEANAFHEGFEDATITRFSPAAEVSDAVADSILTPAEANAYYEGFEAGKAKFVGVVYAVASAE